MKRFIGIVLTTLLTAGVTLCWLVYSAAETGRRENLACVERLAAELASQETGVLRTQENLAMWYNLGLRSQEDTQAFSGAYVDILDYSGHIMGSIEFPRAELILPIRHGEQEEADTKGMTHLPQSAFPIGGTGNHCVLMGQAGLDDGAVFFDLTDLETGDVFLLHTLQKTRTYLVEAVQNTREQPECPAAERDKDLCTLIIRDGDGWVLIRGRAEGD